LELRIALTKRFEMSEPRNSEQAASGAEGDVAPPNTATSGGEEAASQLSKEEQWALFEEELKESDWGHQPC
jgi:hypothetical protein